MDSLYPALEALQDVYKSKGTFSEAWEKAYEGAAKGVLETKNEIRTWKSRVVCRKNCRISGSVLWQERLLLKV